MLNSPLMIIVLNLSFVLFWIYFSSEVSDVIPVMNTQNGLANLYIYFLHYGLIFVTSAYYFLLFWGIIYGLYFLWILINKYIHKLK